MSIDEDDADVRRLMEGARRQLEDSYEEFRSRLEAPVESPPAPAARFQWGRITMAATLLVCATVVATIVMPRATVTQAPAAQDDAKIDALIQQLSDDRPEVREEATRKLVALGDAAVERLRALLDDKDPEVAARARRIIDEIHKALVELPEGTKRRLWRVEAEIARLRAAKKAAEADALAAKLRTVKREVVAGAWPAGDPEVHMVGLYEPRRDDEQAVDVHVTFTGAPIVLIVSAYEQVFWRVKIDKGAQVVKVIVGGYHHQSVEGVPKDVPVETFVHEDGSPVYFYAYSQKDRDGEGSWYEAEHRIRKLTRSAPWTFQGAYRYTGTEFVVGAGADGWSAQRRAAYVERFCEQALASAREHLMSELSRQSFWAVAGDDDGNEVGEFTVEGRKSSVEVRERLAQVVLDGKGRLWGAAGSSLLRIDRETGACTEVKQERRADLPRMSGAAGVAWDSKRGRLLVTSRDTLYAVDPETNEWKVLSRLGRMEQSSALAYAADEDVTYAVVTSLMARHSVSALAKLDAEGATTGSLTLSEPIPVGESHLWGGFQLVCLEGKRLVLIVPPGRDGNGERLGGARTYVIDRTTGEILLER